MGKRVYKRPRRNSRRYGKRYENKGSVGFYLLFPLVLFYYEAVFKISTVGGFFTKGTLFTLVFCIVYGGVYYLLASISRKRKVNRRVTLVLMFLTAVVFLIEYFVYREFKIFYDVNTVLGGASDVAGGFTKEIFSLIFCVNGLTKIFLFLLPMILYFLFGVLVAEPFGADAQKRIITVIVIVAVFFANILVLKATPLGVKYSEEYTFQDATSNFGLITGIRRDIVRNITGANASGEFEETGDEEGDSEGESGEGEDPGPSDIGTEEPGDNVMDINFDALAAGTSSEKLKNLDAYVASLKPSCKNEYTGLFKGKNLIMISAEAFSAEAIDPVLTPTLYRLATRGIQFTDYYQPASAGTTGGEYQNLIGLLPMDGGKSFKNSADHNLYFTMGNQLDRLGYYGKAYHNNTYTYYDRDKTHTNLGYSDGYMGYGNGAEEFITKQWPESDLEMLQGTLPTYIDKQPFNIYYMSVSGHGVYGKNGNAMSGKNWAAVENLDYSEPVKGYLAANIELDKAMEYLVKELEAKGIADDTVICISADHFPYGLDDDAALGKMPYLSELYGYNVTDYFQRDHNRLILWSGCLERRPSITVSSPTFSLDIVPTLSNLFGLEFDSRLLPGRDVFSDAEALVFNTGYDWKTDLGTYISSTGTFTPVSESTVIPEDYVSRIKTVVRNKMNYCSGVLDTDYYAHVFD